MKILSDYDVACGSEWRPPDMGKYCPCCNEKVTYEESEFTCWSCGEKLKIETGYVEYERVVEVE